LVKKSFDSGSDSLNDGRSCHCVAFLSYIISAQWHQWLSSRITESVPKSHDWSRTLKLRLGKREAAEYISIFFYCPTLAEVARGTHTTARLYACSLHHRRCKRAKIVNTDHWFIAWDNVCADQSLEKWQQIFNN